MKRFVAGARLLLLVIMLVAAVRTLTVHDRTTPETDHVHAVYAMAMNQLDSMGRLPLKGAVSGQINNVLQFVSHPTRPGVLGCGDQAQFVLARLDGIPNWKFEMRYEVGAKSPILLPHQWITGTGPGGETIEIDPWADTFIAQ